MIEVAEGNVAVLRNGDFVELVIYRNLYDSLDAFFNEIAYYVEEHRYGEPNVSFMEIKGNRFTPVSSGDFHNEFSLFAERFKLEGKPYCEKCGSCAFLYFEDTSIYCPSCKTYF